MCWKKVWGEFRAQFFADCLGESLVSLFMKIIYCYLLIKEENSSFTSQENRGGELSLSCSDAETPLLKKKVQIQAEGSNNCAWIK